MFKNLALSITGVQKARNRIILRGYLNPIRSFVGEERKTRVLTGRVCTNVSSRGPACRETCPPDYGNPRLFKKSTCISPHMRYPSALKCMSPGM